MELMHGHHHHHWWLYEFIWLRKQRSMLFYMEINHYGSTGGIQRWIKHYWTVCHCRVPNKFIYFSPFFTLFTIPLFHALNSKFCARTSYTQYNRARAIQVKRSYIRNDLHLAMFANFFFLFFHSTRIYKQLQFELNVDMC